VDILTDIAEHFLLHRMSTVFALPGAARLGIDGFQLLAHQWPRLNEILGIERSALLHPLKHRLVLDLKAAELFTYRPLALDGELCISLEAFAFLLEFLTLSHVRAVVLVDLVDLCDVRTRLVFELREQAAHSSVVLPFSSIILPVSLISCQLNFKLLVNFRQVLNLVFEVSDLEGVLLFLIPEGFLVLKLISVQLLSYLVEFLFKLLNALLQSCDLPRKASIPEL